MSVKALSNSVLNTLSGGFTSWLGLFLKPMDPTGVQSWWYLIDLFIRVDRGCAPISAGLVQQDDANATSINLAAGRFSIQGVGLSYAGEVIDLASANNAVSYVWLWNNSGTATIGHALSGTGWPAYSHIKLAEVTLAAGLITVILDRRGEAALSDTPQMAAATTSAKGVVKMATLVPANGSTVSNPPTQAEVLSIQTTVNDTLAALKTAGVMSSV
jgi:hypothetical protein